MSETKKTNEHLYSLIMEVWSSLEDHLTGAEERTLVLKAEVEKVREAQGALIRTLRELQGQVHALMPKAARRAAYADEGDIFGGSQ
jgi:hypothetical protein